MLDRPLCVQNLSGQQSEIKDGTKWSMELEERELVDVLAGRIFGEGREKLPQNARRSFMKQRIQAGMLE